MASSPTQGPTLVQAIYSFKGKNNDELCFKKGDVITVTQKEEGGWWEGTLNGTTGWFPSNYVKEYKPQSVLDGNKTPPAKLPVDLTTQQKVYRNLVLKDLIDSERANVAELQTLINNFLHPLEKADILNRDEYRQLVGNIDTVVETHSKLLIALEACNELPPLEQRVGKIFLTSAPQVKQIHLSYCSSHPRAICILNKHKDALNVFMEAQGAASPGLLVLTTGLSKPFRRLEKYSGILQELERHIEENHPDRGDTQRSFSVYKDIWSACSAKRRQKEQELEILTGGVRGWEGEELSTLGEIIHMGSVAVGPYHRDRYLVLFPTTLLILSVSSRMSGFIYEGKLPLTGINITQLPDSETYKNAFEITGNLIDRIVAVCQTKEDQQIWVDTLRQAIQSVRKSSVSSSQSNPPSHVSPLYTCPYSGLTEYFANLVKRGIITRALLKRLLYRQFADESVSVLGVKVRRSHKVECVIFPTHLSFGAFKSSKTWIKSQIIELDSTSTSSEDIFKPLKRQDAVDCESTSSEESASDCFGYIRYYPVASENYKADFKKCEKDQNKLSQNPSKDMSSQSEGSSFDVPIPVTHRACEDLSALEIVEAVAVEESTRKSLPSIPCTSGRHSVELSHFERSASLDLINLFRFPLRLSEFKGSPNISTISDGQYLDGTQERTNRACECRSSQRMSDCCYQCRTDVHSPRSSDSGLADITGTSVTLSPNNPQDCGQWNSLYDPKNNSSLTHIPVTADEFEAQCICSSPFGSTPRASLQLSLTSKNIIFGHPDSLNPAESYSQLTAPVECDEDSSGVYRSGMYAHWWLKTCIPVDGGLESSEKTSSGKIGVPLTASILSAKNLNKGSINKCNSSWSVTSLRPLPPMRPCVALGKGAKNKQNVSPKKSVDSNFEEDIQILRVIEAYCNGPKPRSASSSGQSANLVPAKEKTENAGEVTNKEKYVLDSVNFLQTQLTDLRKKVNILSLKLDEEIETRTVLQNSVRSQLSKLGKEKG